MAATAFRAPPFEAGVASTGVVEDIIAHAGVLPQVSLDYESEILTLWITLRPEPKPVFTLPLIESVGRVQDTIMELWGRDDSRPVRYVAYRSPGSIFSLGGDLDYYLDCLRANDRAGLRRYADQATKVIRLNRSGLEGSVITLTKVGGKAIGGGIDPARACNVMIAEEDATFSYPEINFNHFPISAVPVLSRHTGPIEAERILLSGDEYSAREFMAKGAVDEVVGCGTGDDWIRNYARRTLNTHGARVALIAAFNEQAGDMFGPLSACARSWTDHILNLKPVEIAKLQRIAAAQERMMSRMLRSHAAAGA
jgi:DSF synthase